MKTVNVLARTIVLSFIVALSAYAEQNSFRRPPKEMHAEFEKKMAAVKMACTADIATLCADAEGPHVIGCLKESQASLTVAACQQAVAQIPDRPHPHGKL